MVTRSPTITIVDYSETSKCGHHYRVYQLERCSEFKGEITNIFDFKVSILFKCSTVATYIIIDGED